MSSVLDSYLLEDDLGCAQVSRGDLGSAQVSRGLGAFATQKPTKRTWANAQVPKSVGVWEVGRGGAPPGLGVGRGGAPPAPPVPLSKECVLVCLCVFFILLMLSVVVHGEKRGRSSDRSILRWESTLELADSIVEASKPKPALIEPQCEESTLVALQSVLNTISAFSGKQIPNSTESPRALVAWTTDALFNIGRGDLGSAQVNTQTGRGSAPPNTDLG